jgi:methylphosphotriester-DNA--protein-cysteine methyltransferase
VIHQLSIHPAQLRNLIRKKMVLFAGNQRLKIYGTFDCSSGKSMKNENRIFFKDEAEAIGEGYRPCGCCLRKKYLCWKKCIATDSQIGFNQ